jgi:hypothetical protein
MFTTISLLDRQTAAKQRDPVTERGRQICAADRSDGILLTVRHNE